MERQRPDGCGRAARNGTAARKGYTHTHVRISDRIELPVAGVPVQVEEEILEVNRDFPGVHVRVRRGEMVGILGRQVVKAILEEIGEIPQQRISERTGKKIVDVRLPHMMKNLREDHGHSQGNNFRADGRAQRGGGIAEDQEKS